jgi:hypothetical protein
MGEAQEGNTRFEDMGKIRIRNALNIVRGMHLPGYIDVTDITNIVLLVVVLAALAVAYMILGKVAMDCLRRLSPARISKFKSNTLWPAAMAAVAVGSFGSLVQFLYHLVSPLDKRKKTE